MSGPGAVGWWWIQIGQGLVSGIIVVEDLAKVALVDGLAAGSAAVEVAGLVDRLAVFPAGVAEVAGLDHGSVILLTQSTPDGPGRFHGDAL